MLSLPASVVVSGLVGIDWTVCSVELVVMTTVVGQPEHIVSAGPGFHGGIVLSYQYKVAYRGHHSCILSILSSLQRTSQLYTIYIK